MEYWGQAVALYANQLPHLHQVLREALKTVSSQFLPKFRRGGKIIHVFSMVAVSIFSQKFFELF